MKINETINPETEFANVHSGGIHMYSKNNPSMHKIGLQTLNLARKRERLTGQSIIKPEGSAELHKSKVDQDFHKQQLKLHVNLKRIKHNILQKVSKSPTITNSHFSVKPSNVNHHPTPTYTHSVPGEL